MIFGTSHGTKELVSVAADYLSKYQAGAIIIAGGIPNYEDSQSRDNSEAAEIAQLITEAVFPSEYAYILEEKSHNMQENVQFSLPLISKFPQTNLAFIGKSHCLTRFEATLQRHLPNTKLFGVSYDSSFDGLLVSRKSWRDSTESKSRVWGEFLRLQNYSARGDIALSPEIQRLISELASTLES